MKDVFFVVVFFAIGVIIAVLMDGGIEPEMEV